MSVLAALEAGYRHIDTPFWGALRLRMRDVDIRSGLVSAGLRWSQIDPFDRSQPVTIQHAVEPELMFIQPT